MTGERIGTVTHFYNRICVAVLELERDLHLGDTIHFLGRHTDFKQQVQSMEIEHQPITEASPGQEVAVKVDRRVRRGDRLYLVTEEVGTPWERYAG